jgi:ABC-type glycerol-3-phosphate transport system substrate-binding protein
MMLKRRHTILAVLVTVILWLFAGSVSAEKVKLTMWLPFNQLSEWAKSFTATFNANNPDIELSIEIMGVTIMREKIVVNTAAGVAPDIVYEAANMIFPLIQQGFMLPLDDYLKTSNIGSDLIPGVIDAYKVNGKTWALPYSIWPLGDVYNMTVLGNSGVTKPTNWDEMIKATRKLTQVNQGVVSVYGSVRTLNAIRAFNYLDLAMEQLGTTSIPPQSAVATINNEASRKALAYLAEEVQAGMPDFRAVNLTAMLQNKVAMYHMVAGWDLVKIADQVAAFDLDIEYDRMVGPETGKDMVMYNAGSLYITTSCKYPDAAWRVIEAFMEPNTLKNHVLAHGASLSMRRSHILDEQLRSFPFAQQLMGTLIEPLSLGSRHPYYSNFRDVAGNFLLQALKGELSIPSALEQAERVINIVLKDLM